MSLADGVNWIVAVDVNDEPFYSSRSASVPIAYDYLGNLEQDKRDCREGRGRLLWRAQEDGTVNISRMLFALPSMQYTGYVIINMDASVFYQDAHRLSNAGSIVFDSYGAPMLHNLDASMEPFLALDPDSREDIPLGAQAYSASWETITNSNLWLCQIVNLGYAPRELQRLTVIYIAGCSCIVLFASLVMLGIFRQINRNIATVQEGISAIAQGDLHHRIAPAAMDEIGMIGTSINTMAGTITRLLQKVGEETLLRRQAEYSQLEFQYRALQAQIIRISCSMRSNPSAEWRSCMTIGRQAMPRNALPTCCARIWSAPGVSARSSTRSGISGCIWRCTRSCTPSSFNS